MFNNTWTKISIVVVILGFVVMNPRFRTLFGFNATQVVGAEQGLEMVTLLPKDAIPSIDNPKFVTGAQADEQYSADELVLGVEINGDARAYSVPFLSGHEIVNDVVGGEPIAVTW